MAGLTALSLNIFDGGPARQPWLAPRWHALRSARLLEHTEGAGRCGGERSMRGRCLLPWCKKPLHLHCGVHRLPHDANCRCTVNEATPFASCLIVTTGAIKAEMRNL